MARPWRLAFVAALALLGRPILASAAPPPSLTDGFGINGLSYLHYRDAPDVEATARSRVAALKRAGVTWDRFDLWWSVVEPEKGRWDWSRTDWLVNLYHRSGIRMLPILCYGAAWMGRSPHTAEDFAAYSEFVRRAVQRYRDRVSHWEIWNEPTIPTFWKPQPDPAAYAELLKAAYRAAHQSDPGCVVVGGATSETDLNFLQALADHGALKSLDAVSVHPYSMSDGPEQMHLARQVRNVREWLRLNGRPSVPIWVTEMGWISSIDDQTSMRVAARYTVQSHALLAAEGVQRLFWFNLQDWREGDRLEGWGLISPEGREKLTMAAFRQMTRALRGWQAAGYAPVVGPGQAVVFRRWQDVAGSAGGTDR